MFSGKVSRFLLLIFYWQFKAIKNISYKTALPVIMRFYYFEYKITLLYNRHETGSQKVGGSNPPSSTKKANTANPTSKELSTNPNSHTQLALSLERLIEGFLLSSLLRNSWL